MLSLVFSGMCHVVSVFGRVAGDVPGVLLVFSVWLALFELRPSGGSWACPQRRQRPALVPATATCRGCETLGASHTVVALWIRLVVLRLTVGFALCVFSAQRFLLREKVLCCSRSSQTKCQNKHRCMGDTLRTIQRTNRQSFTQIDARDSLAAAHP